MKARSLISCDFAFTIPKSARYPPPRHPYDSDSRKWLEKDWIDQHSGERFRITTKGDYGTRYAARVKTYGEVVGEYESHPEAKCADSQGNPCGRQTVGLLQRRHIKVDQIKAIGKESNSLESVEEGAAHSEVNVYTEYVDPKRTEWRTKMQPVLRKLPLHLLAKACERQISRRELIELRAGRSKPHRKTQDLLVSILKVLGLL